MNLKDLCQHWARLHQEYGIGGPVRDEAHCQALLNLAESLIEEAAVTGTESAPGLLDIIGQQIREYEARTAPWPDTAQPAEVLRLLMEEHGLNQSQLPEVGSQGVVSEILRGRRQLNVRQIGELAARFGVSPAVFVPAPAEA